LFDKSGIENNTQEFIMRDMKNFEVPNEMRDFAEKSVEQARSAFDKFLEAARRGTNTASSAAEATRANVQGMTAQGFEYAEQNVNAALDFAKRLVRAKDAQEAMKLQADFVREQFSAIQNQAKDMASSAQEALPKQPGKSA
jgi:phasin